MTPLFSIRRRIGFVPQESMHEPDDNAAQDNNRYQIRYRHQAIQGIGTCPDRFQPAESTQHNERQEKQTVAVADRASPSEYVR